MSCGLLPAYYETAKLRGRVCSSRLRAININLSPKVSPFFKFVLPHSPLGIMRASFLNVILYAAFAVGFPSQHIEQRGKPATLDQATAADAPVKPPIAARSPTSDPGDYSNASSVAIALREAEPAGNDVLAVSVDEREIKGRQYAPLT
ncbi:hypothetical protein B0J13DRAFT_632565 [Dactylonectria estremocensis]|uniref:Uncharacterized protein n=1 Tax=Dactylonectria estremocensis TaxID=1079267 RepID=A0A9P9CXC9_9HYPO|nr:hypothetical protein B0J13DRAFT_632565 [Dactylonectria estremocensis]